MARSSVAQLVLAESSCVSVLQVLLSAEPTLEVATESGAGGLALRADRGTVLRLLVPSEAISDRG